VGQRRNAYKFSLIEGARVSYQKGAVKSGISNFLKEQGGLKSLFHADWWKIPGGQRLGPVAKALLG